MLILGKRKHSVPTLLAILLILASKSTSDDSLQVKNDGADKVTTVSPKVLEEISEEKDDAFSNSEKSSDDAKPEKADQQENPNDREEDQNEKPEESDNPPRVENRDSKQSNEKVEVEEAEEHSPAPLEENTEENKSEVADESQKLGEETKKQNDKLGDNSRKISLSDVNSITYDESHTKQSKRETRTTEFLGLPRDASYFFDDLEPFINNNSAKDNSQENARAVRAIPSRQSIKENKIQRSKLGAKKDMMEEEVEEEEEEYDDNVKMEEEEDKANEGDYDDDEDLEPDCPPTGDSCTTSSECTPSTPECTTTSQCTTTPQCTTTTTCTPRKTTTKCTTRFTCSTKCTTPEECTRCPKICAKANRKNMGYRPTTLKSPEWDDLDTKNPRRSTEQKPQQALAGVISKKKFHSKANSGKMRM